MQCFLYNILYKMALLLSLKGMCMRLTPYRLWYL